MAYPTNQIPYQIAGNYADQSATQPAPSTRLSGIAAHLESLNGELGVVVERLTRLADRLNGAVPQEVAKDPGQLRGSGGGLATLIESHLENSGTLVNRLRNVLERLETL
jgi:hypothetical protein